MGPWVLVTGVDGLHQSPGRADPEPDDVREVAGQSHRPRRGQPLVPEPAAHGDGDPVPRFGAVQAVLLAELPLVALVQQTAVRGQYLDDTGNALRHPHAE